ncbi:hypothetical protein K440DRAFT_683089 [Wilcoxina mikolae CBS 423.85]|nr:hypothetical protein K440DRAFT_683089 [Wilcoxina mikolae CBS 423.85]
MSWTHLLPNSRILVVSVIIAGASLVNSQQPVAELGRWPAGAFTLLVGMWLGLKCICDTNYDALPTVSASQLLHKIPWVRRELRASSHIGTMCKSIVFASPWNVAAGETCIVQEWDTLIVTPEAAEVEDSCIIIASKHSKVKYTISFNGVTGLDLHYEQATEILFDGMGNPSDLETFVKLWRGLRIYQGSPTKARWTNEKLVTAHLDDAVNFLCENMKAPGTKWAIVTASKENKKLCRPLSETTMMIYLEDSICEPSAEVSPGASVRAGHLAADKLALMLAYVKCFCVLPSSKTSGGGTAAPENTYLKQLNPFMPCILFWKLEKLSLDSFHLTLLPTHARGDLEANRTETMTSLTADDIWEVDGQQTKSWKTSYVASLASGSIVTLFTVLATNINPSLATTIGLMFLKPHTNDYSLRDAGTPPSWNGRSRIRWEEGGYGCGIFSGTYHKRMGKSGTSAPRVVIIHILSWLTWVWREALRRELGFKKTEYTGCVEMGALGCVFGEGRGGNFDGFSVLTVLFYMSEVGAMMAGVLNISVILVGVGSSNGPIEWHVVIMWVHIVASSCFALVRGVS